MKRAIQVLTSRLKPTNSMFPQSRAGALGRAMIIAGNRNIVACPKAMAATLLAVLLLERLPGLAIVG